MSAQPSSNSNTGSQPAAPTVILNDSEAQKMYRDTTLYVRETYFPHYNLYNVSIKP